jgi:hypothetical protein
MLDSKAKLHLQWLTIRIIKENKLYLLVILNKIEIFIYPNLTHS